jgi:integrase
VASCTSDSAFSFDAGRKLSVSTELNPKASFFLRVKLPVVWSRLSSKALSEQLDTQLNSLSVDQLRNVIRRMSRDITPRRLRPEHFDRVLADGKVSTNVYLRRIHNHALGMEWLLKSVIPRRQWPKPVFRQKRAITAEEHSAIMKREPNEERRDFYEMLWHTGAAQSDAGCLMASDVDWNQRTICYSRKKLKSRDTENKPALIRFGEDLEAILKRRPATGPLFPYLRTVRPGDRATEFKQRCDTLGIRGISLHSYRYAWAERALQQVGLVKYRAKRPGRVAAAAPPIRCLRGGPLPVIGGGPAAECEAARGHCPGQVQERRKVKAGFLQMDDRVSGGRFIRGFAMGFLAA